MRIAANDFVSILAKGPPEIGLAILDMMRDMWLKGTIGVRLQELLRLKSAELARCEYALHIRFAEPQEAGLTEAEIAQIADPGRSSLSERENLALQYAELLITNPDAITDPFFEEMRLHFSESQLVELTYFVMQCNQMHRFAVALRLPPESKGSIVVRRLGIPSIKPRSNRQARQDINAQAG